MTALPASLALTSIPDGALEIAADPRNNFAATQTAMNTLIACLAGGAGGQLLSALSSSSVGWAYPPGFEIAYDQITAAVNVVSTTEGTPTSVIAGSSHVYENVPYLFEFFTPALVAPNGVDAFTVCLLLEDGVNVGRIGVAEGVTAATGLNYPAAGNVRRTPAAGAHTYSVAAYCSTTTGTPAVLAGAAGSGALVASYLRAVKV